jgi:hypothetical protein
MKKLLLILFTALILLSCTNSDDGIDFIIENNAPIVTANINGLPVKLLIDTGASVSLIDVSTQPLLLFTQDLEVPTTVANGLGGQSYLFGVKDAEVYYEGYKLEITFKGTDLSNFRFGTGVVGIIGADFLIENGLIIDFPSRKLRYGVLE